MEIGETLRLRGVWRVTLRDAHTGRVVSDHTYRNVICANGKAVIASWLNIESPSQTLTNIYGAVGTSSTTPVSTDTQLGAEIGRVVLGTNSRATNAVTMQFFFNTSQANGTWAEAGLFLQANSSANNGQLLSHVAVSEVKTNLVTATLSFSITIG